MTTLPELLEHRARTTPDGLAYAALDGPRVDRRTWAELAGRARAVGAQLRGAGLMPGDRALLAFPEGNAFLDAWFGCLAVGVLAVPAHPPDPLRLARTLPRLIALRADCTPRALLTVPALAEALRPVADGLPVLFPPTAPDGPERGPTHPNAVAYLQYTSGSTTEPRGVRVTHHNLVHQLEQFDHGHDHGPGSVIVSWLPATHDLGLVYGRLMGLWKGIPTVHLDPAAVMARPRVWLEALTAWRGTHTPTPNFGLDVAARRIDDLHGLDLSSVRVLLNGAEPIRRESEVRFVERFMAVGLDPRAITHAMGMSEATAKIVSEPVGRGGRFAVIDARALAEGRAEPCADGPGAIVVASNGGPAPATRVRIVDPTSLVVLPDDAVGELWVGGATVADGYWERPEASEALFRARTSDGDGPFLRTGDLGFLRDGELYLVGRKKDVIIVRGQNHHPQDLEWAIEGAHPALRPGCAAAFGLPGPDGEEQVGLVVEVREGPIPVDNVFGAIRARLSDLGLSAGAIGLLAPRALPKTSSGKLQRSAAREGFLDGSLAVLHRWERARQGVGGPSPADLRAMLIHEASNALGLDPADVDTDRPLKELGLDSVSAVSLLERVGRALGRELPVTLIFDHPTLDALAAALGPPPSRPAARSDRDVASMSEAEAEAALLAELEDL
jgi:acyl-CoA synthetase (AMP-forming)/AMP-acid ligase II/acyl carrier protein